MIFAAGQGTRLKPLTDAKPKALVEIGGKTLLERAVTYLKSHGITNITVNVFHYAGQIRDFLQQRDNFGTHMQVSDETGMLLDTGGGLLKAREFLEGEEPILLINVDILTNLDLHHLFQAHARSGALVSLVVRRRNTSRYLLFDRHDQLTGWKNSHTGEIKMRRPGASAGTIPMAFSGIHLIEPALFSLVRESGRFSVIDLYLRLSASEKIMAFTDNGSIWMDLGKFEDFARAEALVRQIEEEE